MLLKNKENKKKKSLFSSSFEKKKNPYLETMEPAEWRSKKQPKGKLSDVNQLIL